MRIAKKVLSLILAFCLAFGVLTVGISAVDSPAVADAIAQTRLRVVNASDETAVGTSLAPGQVLKCYVGWYTNYNWRTIMNVAYYDSTYFVPCLSDGTEMTTFCSGPTILTDAGGAVGALEPIYGDSGIGDYLSGSINQTIATATVSQYFAPEMRETNATTGRPTTTLLEAYNTYQFVYFSISTDPNRGTGESFLLGSKDGSGNITYSDYAYFYIKVKDDAPSTTASDKAGLFMHEGSTKGTGSTESIYSQGKTACSYIPSETIVTATTLSRTTCTVDPECCGIYYNVGSAAAEDYTVSFDLNGGTGTVPEGVTGATGTAVTLPAQGDIAKSGFTFLGWNTTNNATTALTSYAIPENGATLYAVWEAIPTYTVSFDLNGGTGTVPTAVTNVAGTAVTLPAQGDIAKSGFTFLGWNTTSTATTALTSYAIPENGATLYAVWEAIPTYTVSFDLNGGTGTVPTAVTDVTGTAVTLPAQGDIAKSGFTFLGWNTTSTATTALASYAIGSDDATLYAIWEEIPESEYTVSFSLNGGAGTTPAPVTGVVGTAVTLPAQGNITKSGFTFLGWNITNNATTALASYTIPENGATLYAVWEAIPTYTVSFDVNGGTGSVPAPVTGVAGTAVTLPAQGSMAKVGSSFLGWNTTSTATTALASYSIPENGAILYAIWSVNNYTITYVAATTTTTDYAYGAAVTINEVPYVTGKTGVWEWTKTADGTATTAPTTMPAYGLTATAVYSDIQVSYKVETYEMDTTGAYILKNETTETANFGEDVTYTPAAAATGFTLVTDAPSVLTGNVGETDNSLTIKVYYSRNQYTFNYTVKGENYTSQTYYYDQVFAFPTAPTLTAPESFVQWTLNGVAFTAPTKVGVYTSPVELVAEIDDGTVQPADYTALYAFLDSRKPLATDLGFQTFFYLLPQSAGSYLERAAETLAKYSEPAKTALTNALSFRTDCTEAEQATVDGYLTAIKSAYNTYVVPVNANEEFTSSVTDPYGASATEIGYRNPYLVDYFNTLSSALDIKQVQSSVEGTYVFDVLLSSNVAVSGLGFPILINSEKYEIGTIPGTTVSFTTPQTEFFTKSGGFNEFFAYPIEGQSIFFRQHDTTTSSNKGKMGSMYPQGPGWSAYDDITFRNKYSIDFSINIYTLSATDPSVVQSADDLVIATFAIKLKDGAVFDKDDTFMVGDYFIGNGKTGDSGCQRINYYLYETETTQISRAAYNDGQSMVPLTTTVEWLAEPESYSVSYDLNGGTLKAGDTMPETESVVDGTEVTLSNIIPEKTGFEFLGWATSADATTAITTERSTITGETTFYAVWEALSFNYTINNYFMGVDGTYPSEPSTVTLQAPFGTEIILSAENITAYDNFTFDESAEGNVLTGTVNENGTMALSVYYTRAQYTITYVADSPVSSQTVYYAATVTPAAVPQKADGATGIWVWTKTADGTALTVPATMPAYDITATADYSGSYASYKVKTYTQASDGTWNITSPIIDTFTGVIGDAVDATPSSYPTGFELGEQSAPTGTILADDALELTVYLARSSYTVTYMVDGVENSSAEYLYGASIVAILPPVDGNGNNGMWSWMNSAGPVEAPTSMPAENLIATAVYPIEVVPTVYTMNTAGEYDTGAPGASVFGYIGETVDATPNPVPTGFAVDTTLSSPTGEIINENGTADTLTVYLERQKYTISYYNLQGGLEYTDEYYFEEDVTGRQGVWADYIPGTMPAENLTINARTPVQYTITYKVPGENDSVVNVLEGDAVTPRTLPDVEGYTSNGWDWTDGDNLPIEAPTVMPAENITATLNVTVNSYTVTYWANGVQVGETQTYDFGDEITGEAPNVPEETGKRGEWDSVAPETMPAHNIVITAEYTENTYYIYYIVENEGTEPTVVDTQSYVFGTDVTGSAPAVPNLTGNSGAWDQEAPAVMPANDITIKAVYTPNEYTITYHADGYGEDGIVDVQTYTYGTPVTGTAPAVPAKEGFGDGAWATSAPATMPAENLVIEAIYGTLYSITYYADGNIVDTQYYEEGDTTSAAPAIPFEGDYAEGYLAHWDNETPATMPAENVVITAVYDIQSYTITYVSEMLQNNIVETYEYNATTDPAPVVPEKEGFTGNWDAITPATMPARNITITAVYTENQYTITYVSEMLQDSIVETYGFGDTVAAAPAVPEKEGFTGEWDQQTPATMPAENLVITAVYTANEYTITYKSEMLQNDIVETYDFGDTVAAAPAVPVKEGFTGVWDQQTPATMPAINITITAIYTANEYTITYKSEMFANDIVETYDFGDTVAAAPAVPEKEGFTGEWDQQTPATMPAEDIVITAVYTANEYTITYKSEMLQNDIVETYDFGDTVAAAPAVPEKEGFTGEWDQQTPATMPAEDLVITAVYTVNEYTITYVVEGQEPTIVTYNYDADVATPEDPSRIDYIFIGWDTEIPAKMPAQNLIITAQFELDAPQDAKLVWSAGYTAPYDCITPVDFEIEASTGATKVSIQALVNGSLHTWTYVRASAAVSIADSATQNREVWTISGLVLPANTYMVRAKFDNAWTTDGYSKEITIVAPIVPVAEPKKVYSAAYTDSMYDGLTPVDFAIEVDAGADKLSIQSIVNGSLHTWTYTVDSAAVSIAPSATEGREVWTISGLVLPENTYTVRSKFDNAWTTEEYSATAVVEFYVAPVTSKIVSVEYDESYDGTTATTFEVSVFGQPEKIRIQSLVDGALHTWTYARENAKVVIEDMGEGYETWSITVALPEGDYTAIGKFNGAWLAEDKDCDFTVDFYVAPIAPYAAVSATQKDAATFEIVVSGTVSKIQFVSEAGTWTYTATNGNVSIAAGEQEGTSVWTISNLLLPAGEFTVNAKGEAGWTTDGNSATITVA